MPRSYNPLSGHIEFTGADYVEQTRAPTTTDVWKDTTIWIDTATNNVYMAIDTTLGVTTWVTITNAGGTMTDLTGDTGTATPSAGVIQIAGGEGINTSATGAVVTIAGEDAGTSNKGILETATDAEAIAVTLSDKAIVPSNLDNVFAEPPALGGTTPSTGAFTTLILSGVGAVSALDVVPASTIAGVSWKGVDVNCAALDPSASGAVVDGLYVDMTGVSQTNDPELHGAHIEMPSTYSGTLGQCAGLFEGYDRQVVLCCGENGTAVRLEGEIHINYDGTSAVAGQTLTIEDFIVDITGSTGGDIHAMDVAVAGAGSVDISAIGTHPGVGVIHQHVGSYIAPTKAWKYDGSYTDVTTEFGSAASDVAILASLNDLIYVGADAIYDEIRVILAAAADKDLQLTFEYSIAGPAWTAFSPADDTIGFKQNGLIRFSSGDLSGWASVDVNGTSKYYIRITRGRATAAATTPTEDTIKTLAATQYEWDSSGDLTVNELKPATDLAVQYGGTGASTLTGILIGNGTSAVGASTVTQYGTVVAGASNTVSSVAPSATSGVPLISQGASSNPTYGTVVVAGGGTGATTLTGILIGNGTSAVGASTVTQYGTVVAGASNTVSSVAPSATSGVPLISQGASSNPTYGTVVVAGGGTGATTLTGILIGNGTSAVGASTVTQYGTVVAGASNTVSSVAPSATSGVPLISQGASSNPTYGTVVVAGGGTGQTTYTDGQLLIGNTTGNTLAKATLTAGTGVAITNGSGSITVAASGGGLTWTVVTGATAGAINNGYLCNNAGTRVVVTLPTTAAVGSIVRVGGVGAAGWGIAQNASELCHVGNQVTTTGTGGKIESTHENDAIELVCIVANTEWLSLSSMGNLTIT